MRTTMVILLIVLAVVLSQLSVAGQGHEPSQRESKRLHHLTHQLNLSADQLEQIKPILAQQAEQRQAIRESMRSLHEQTQQQIAEVLTDEQREKLLNMRPPKRMRKQCHSSEPIGEEV